MKIKAFACVGTHGKPYVTEISQDISKSGRFEIFLTHGDAMANAIGRAFVREVVIEILPPRKLRKSQSPATT